MIELCYRWPPGTGLSPEIATTEEYDPWAQQWRARANLPEPRSGIAVGVINVLIYVVGGESKEGTFSVNEASFRYGLVV